MFLHIYICSYAQDSSCIGVRRRKLVFDNAVLLTHGIFDYIIVAERIIRINRFLKRPSIWMIVNLLLMINQDIVKNPVDIYNRN